MCSSDLYEGGLRVPAIIEWPKGIPSPRVSSYPACTMDIFSTLANVTGLADSVMLQPQDGVSLAPLFDKDLKRRENPIGFRHTGRAALIDNNYKLITLKITEDKFLLFDLDKDPHEQHDLFNERPKVARRLKAAFQKWNQSVAASVAGQDYPEGTVSPSEPQPRFWTAVKEYQPYFEAWKKRPEYKSRLK